MNNTGIQFISASLLLVWLFACAGPPEKQAIKKELFKTHNLEFSNSKLHYVTSGSSENQPILFIHGTPGDWSSFSDLMQTETMQENFYMFSIDRLGWGKSTIQNQNVEARFKPHTDAINTLLKDIVNTTGKKVIVAGHSLGGTLAPMVAIESPDYVKALVILAGDLDPRFGEPRWYNRLANVAFIQWLLPSDLKKSQ